MRREQSNEGHNNEIRQIQPRVKDGQLEDFVLEKSIFNNVFEKDIRRVFIYKKAERLAKALHLIAPAFSESESLRDRIGDIAVNLIDAATASSGAVRATLSRELLALSSILSVARTGGFLSGMNTEIITKEVHSLLQEVASYEEPRLFLNDIPTLSGIAKSALPRHPNETTRTVQKRSTHPKAIKDISDTNPHIKDRRETILSVMKNKHKASIKDISTLIRGVSEKTIQRELSALVEAGMIIKEGERRWSTYSLVS